MMKRLFLFCMVMLTASLAFAGGAPTGGNGAQAAEDDSPQRHQRTEAQAREHAAPQHLAPTVLPLPEKLQHRIEKIGQKMEKRQLRHSTKDVKGTNGIPDQVKWWLILGLVLILAGAILFFIMPWLGSLVSSAGVICLLIALIIYLINYA